MNRQCLAPKLLSLIGAQHGAQLPPALEVCTPTPYCFPLLTLLCSCPWDPAHVTPGFLLFSPVMTGTTPGHHLRKALRRLSTLPSCLWVSLLCLGMYRIYLLASVCLPQVVGVPWRWDLAQPILSPSLGALQSMAVDVLEGTGVCSLLLSPRASSELSMPCAQGSGDS